MTLLILAIYVLAVARLTRLINFDVVADPIRVAVARRASVAKSAAAEATLADQYTTAALHQRREGRWNTAAYLLECPWCIGFWLCLASAYAPVAIIGWPWWSLFPVALAASHIIGIAARLAAPDDEMSIEPAPEHG
ncbi:hypothetical protein B1R94_02280 [Mycolicibacterium litorale]|nr:hypothetical protein B1R94_02280 [Mycolicibacterium litorale]